MKLAYSFFLLILLVHGTVNAQKKPKSCGFDVYRESIFSENPGLKNALKQSEANFKTSKSARLSSDELIIIPVVVHIIHQGGEAIGSGSNITDEKVNEQIQILNDFYSNSNNKGVDSNIRFCLAKNNISGGPTSGIVRNLAFQESYDNPAVNLDEDRSLKLLNGAGLFPSNTYLNIWVTTLEDSADSDNVLLGYSSFPFPSDPNSSILDGVVIDYRNFGKTDRAGADEGMTAVHEIGHWLGLFHTFQTDLIDDNGTADPDDDVYSDQCQEIHAYCDVVNDRVCDTEPVKGPAQLLPAYETNPAVGKDCDGNNSNAVQNVMDYNDDEYYSFFTSGQVERMREQLQMYRPFFTRINVSLTECTVPLNYNPDIPGGCDEYPEIIEDDWGYRIKGVPSGINSLDNETLVILGSDRFHVIFYKINECGVEEEERLYFSDQIGYIGNIYLKDNFLFVQRAYDSQVSSVLVYKRNSINAWEYKQELLGLSSFGEQIIFKDNILLIKEPSKILAYNYNGAIFADKHALDHYDLGVHSITEFDFNGQFLALKTSSPGRRLELHLLNSSNNFVRLFPNNSEENDLYRPHSIALTNKNANRLFLGTDQQFITELNLNDLSPSGEPKKVLTKNVNTFRLGRLALQDELLISLDVHVKFYDISSNNLPQILLPINFPLDHQYSTRTSSGLFPVPRRYSKNRWPVSPAGSARFTPKVDGNIMLLQGSCSDIYLYNLESLLNLGNSDRQICQQALGADYIRGRNITLGGSNCVVDIVDKVEIAATETITLKPGTTISAGSNFLAKVKPKSSCNLTGGHALSVPLTNSTYTALRFNIEDINEVNTNEGIEIKIYPNPTKGILEINNESDNLILSSTIYGLNNIRSFHFDNDQKLKSFELDLSHLPTGLFILNLIMEDGNILSRKIIKE